MKLLLSWLRDYVAVPDDVDLDALSDTLAMLGLPVEDIVRTGGVPGVITARVVRTEQPPEARNTQRVWVDAGDGKERHVWCGAFNFAPGDVVPLAVLGTEMPDGRTIARRGILGIDSDGMLCSARELGLGDDHSGILVLPPDSPLGVPYGEVTGLRDDVVLDVDVTRNRPDCWSYLGVARDLAAKLGLAFTPPTPPEPKLAEGGPVTTVEIVDGDRCGRFTSTVIGGVAVGPSAPWMAERLTAAGMRPINNVVDVSNYVMLELGQPNHAYDLATLGGDGFRIRRARDGEEITTLDDVTRRLTPADLLICDANDRPIGIGGIMGGADTEISDATTTVALEIAWFTNVGIGLSAARLGLRSEASARNERGVDPWQIDTSVARFVELLGETCPDLVVHAGAVDARAESLPPRERSCDGAHQPGQPHHRDRPDRRRPAPAARSDRLHRQRCRRRAHGGPADVATRQHRGDRRRRGGRPAVRLRPGRQAAADGDHPRPPVRPAAASAPVARRAARARGHRGDAEPVPRPRHARRAPGWTAMPCASRTRS